MCNVSNSVHFWFSRCFVQVRLIFCRSFCLHINKSNNSLSSFFCIFRTISNVGLCRYSRLDVNKQTHDVCVNVSRVWVCFAQCQWLNYGNRRAYNSFGLLLLWHMQAHQNHSINISMDGIAKKKRAKRWQIASSNSILLHSFCHSLVAFYFLEQKNRWRWWNEFTIVFICHSIILCCFCLSLFNAFFHHLLFFCRSSRLHFSSFSLLSSNSSAQSFSLSRSMSLLLFAMQWNNKNKDVTHSPSLMHTHASSQRLTDECKLNWMPTQQRTKEISIVERFAVEIQFIFFVSAKMKCDCLFACFTRSLSLQKEIIEDKPMTSEKLYVCRRCNFLSIRKRSRKINK